MTQGKNAEYSLKDKINIDGIYSSNSDIVIRHIAGTNYSNNLEFINTTFKTTETGKISFGAKQSSDECNFYFENCTFDGVFFNFCNRGHYTFNNCTFINCAETALEIRANNVYLNVYNSTIKNNAPNKEEFNENVDSVRYWKYAAIGYRGFNDDIVHMFNSTIENYMAFTIIYLNSSCQGCELYFEQSQIKNVAGHAIGMNAAMKGRIDNNKYVEIEGLGGADGYAADNVNLDGICGNGIGGNAVFGRKESRSMRVYNNYIKNVMENAIEGHYYCVNNNNIINTGYRYEQGFTTPSTEAIWGSTWLVKDNIITNVHGRGIMVSLWKNHQVEVSGNNITKGSRNVDEDYEGIRITASSDSSDNVLVTNNQVVGFVNKYRVRNNSSAKIQKNIIINDSDHGKLMGSVYSNLLGVQLTAERQQKINFENANMSEIENEKIKGWSMKNLSNSQVMNDGNTQYVELTSSQNRGGIYQIIDLPKQTCIICLKITARSSADNLYAYITSKDDNGNIYLENDGASYSESKVIVKPVSATEFQTYYLCMKAIDHTEIGILTSSQGQTIDLQSIEGYYMTDNDPIQLAGEDEEEENNNKSIIIQGENKIKITEELTQSDVASFYGNEVIYTPKGKLENIATSDIYRIFYIDTEGKYGNKGDIYLKQDCDNNTNELSTTYSESNMDKNLIKKLHPSWSAFDGEALSLNKNNQKCSAYLFNKEIWGKYANSIADYAIGAVPLELWVDSYNSYQTHIAKGSTISVDYDSGYKINNTYSVGINKTNTANNMYNPGSGKGYWLSAPSYTDPGHVIAVIGSENVIKRKGRTDSLSYCTLIKLNTGATIKLK